LINVLKFYNLIQKKRNPGLQGDFSFNTFTHRFNKIPAMINLKKILIFIMFLFSADLLFSQEFGMGLLLDDSLYANSPTAAPLMRGDYADLPSTASLKSFSPSTGNQGPYGTCAGWSTAYSARTILEAIRKNWNRTAADSNTFSPSFVYNQIRMKKNCTGGTSLISALDVLREQGGVKLKDFAYDCEREVSDTDINKAAEYKIIEYRDITQGNKIINVKKSLAEGRPVVIAMDCPISFNRSRELWLPDSSDYKDWGRGHALTVIGYDDNKAGGAFELMNSWGKFWGKEGFAWIRYSDFDFFCKYAFEIIDKSRHDPEVFDLSGTLSFSRNDDQEMKAVFNGEYFKMEKSYPSGTLFELIVSNNEPAYVYAFSSDLTYKIYKIFPFDQRMNAYLPYKQNNVAIPDEESYNMLDENTGSSYYCFLYSKESLDIDRILTEIESSEGSFWERLNKAVAQKRVEKQNIFYNYNEKVTFRAKSKGKSVVPVLVEINHLKE
jgi:hypothetical protein